MSNQTNQTSASGHQLFAQYRLGVVPVVPVTMSELPDMLLDAVVCDENVSNVYGDYLAVVQMVDAVVRQAKHPAALTGVISTSTLDILYRYNVQLSHLERMWANFEAVTVLFGGVALNYPETF